jgi:nicotinate-nucleotide adenylyltransferase
MDEVWFLPCFLHNFDKQLTPWQVRLSMVQAIKISGVQVSTLEIERKGVSYTIDTMDLLKKKYPQDEFFWLMSSDQLPVFQKYKDWQQIILRHKLIVFPRESLSVSENNVKKYLELDKLPESITIVNHGELIATNISSSVIRQRVKKGLPISYFVPPEVEKIIKKNKLYE